MKNRNLFIAPTSFHCLLSLFEKKKENREKFYIGESKTSPKKNRLTKPMNQKKLIGRNKMILDVLLFLCIPCQKRKKMDRVDEQK